MQALFPCDNILARLCDEQKFFKTQIAPFSHIIPYCELKVSAEKLRGMQCIIEKTAIEKNKKFGEEKRSAKQFLVKQCFARSHTEKIFVGNFILGSFKTEERQKVIALMSQNRFPDLSFKVFYTCDFVIKNEKFCSWYISNIVWYK